MDVYDDGGDIFGVPTLISPTDGKFPDLVVDLSGSSSKVQVVAYPTQLPSKCACCGSVPNGHTELKNTRYFVDFGLDLNEFGTVYLCSDCFVEAASKFGFINGKHAAEYAFQIDALTQENINLRSQVESVKSVTAAIVNLHSVVDSSDSSVLDAAPTTKTKSRVNASSNEPRSNDVPDIASLDEALAI